MALSQADDPDLCEFRSARKLWHESETVFIYHDKPNPTDASRKTEADSEPTQSVVGRNENESLSGKYRSTSLVLDTGQNNFQAISYSAKRNKGDENSEDSISASSAEEGGQDLNKRRKLIGRGYGTNSLLLNTGSDSEEDYFLKKRSQKVKFPLIYPMFPWKKLFALNDS